MKTISRYIMTLALLLTAVTGAWAADTYTITFSGFGNEACNKTVTDATLEYSETFNIADVYANYTIFGGVRNSNEYVSISYQGNDITITVKSPFEGTVNVTVDYMNENWDECQRNISVTCVKSAPAITVEWNASTKTGTFAMPASDVVLTPIYAKAAAFATTGTEPEVKTLLPEAAEGVIAGTDASLIAEGTGIVASVGTSTEVTQGTLMYAVGTSATEAPALTAFNATVPTAKDIADDGATVYVWYYIQGADAPEGVAATLDNTFDNTEPACLTVQVLTNKFDIQFNAANANTIEAGNATVTVGGTDKTGDITEGKLEGVKMGSEVKVKANTGYKFRKVEVKKGGAATLATALENGATVVIAFKYRDDGTCTFTNNNGTFTFVSGTGQLGGGNGPKQLSVENGKLIFKGSTTNSFTDRWSWYGFQVTFDPTANTYEVWKGSDLDVASFTSISVNGTDITDQLSELK